MAGNSSQQKVDLRGTSLYDSFDQLDGQHPWMEAIPNSYVTYRVRKLNQGHVSYFNFALAKEMGLIPSSHSGQMTTDLESKLLDTFSLQIINEYDELSKRRIPQESIKPNQYMATRYLQLQHSNKQGKTSGDGRGIWNGTIKFRGQVWDVSSRGTGVTCLAPGAVQANRPLKTGATEFGYGCGQAEIDELISAAISAETMHLQGIPTERVLCIVDLGKGVGIGVRAAKNLMRPAHLFKPLKQGKYDELKKAFDYAIERQVQNKQWHFNSNQNKYSQALELICRDFANFTAKLDVDYIFAWLDWDGDNVLVDAGIIDYGSIRQFGIRHDSYRYDDVERFSTNLNEQRKKARLIVQVFAQMVDFLKTGERKPMSAFANDPVVLKFNQQFSEFRSQRFLYRMGFTSQQRQKILKEHRSLFEEFDEIFSRLERSKVSAKPEKVADGVNHPPLYNMRAFLREYPKFLQSTYRHDSKPIWKSEELYRQIRSSFAKKKDFNPKASHIKSILKLQNLFQLLLQAAFPNKNFSLCLDAMVKRSQKLNSDERITGNALIEIVDEILVAKKRGLDNRSFQAIVDKIVSNYLNLPEVESSRHLQKMPIQKKSSTLYAKILSIVKERSEDI